VDLDDFFFSFEGTPRVAEIALGDLNGNGYLDAYLAINYGGGDPYLHPDYVLINQGNGSFIASGQSVENFNSSSVTLVDVNGDGHLDAVVGHYNVSIIINYDRGNFDRGSYSAGIDSGAIGRAAVALGDLNGSGSFDIFVPACCGGIDSEGNPFFSPDVVRLNRGDGRFFSNGQQLAQTGSNAVALGDLNGSGFIDAFIAAGQSTNPDGSNTSRTPNMVWFNTGQGQFQDSGQRLGDAESMAVVLGDLNRYGFLDAVVGNRGADEVWFNDGQGNFSDSGQRLGSGLTRSVFLDDLDGDGDLDLVVGRESSAQIWLNDGTGQFSQGESISYDHYEAITLGDVTGDGFIDILVAGVESYQVWHGQGNGLFTAGAKTRY
jgi:hypothetical protein